MLDPKEMEDKCNKLQQAVNILTNACTWVTRDMLYKAPEQAASAAKDQCLHLQHALHKSKHILEK